LLISLWILIFIIPFFIVLETYIKTNFAEVHDNKLNKYIGCGSVTDGTFKLEIHILNFSIDDYSILNLNKGDKVQMIGVIQTNGNKFIINKI